MAALLNDLRFGARLLWRAPTFTVIAVASLALGIGANAAIFSAINALLLRPVPAAAPDRLVAIFTSDFSGPTHGSSSYADALDFARAAPALSELAAVSVEPLSLTAGPEPERVFAEVVSPNYFSVLGIQPAAGRFFAGPLDGRAADPPMAVLSYRYWQRRFAGDLSVVGRTVRIGVEPTTIVGRRAAGVSGTDARARSRPVRRHPRHGQRSPRSAATAATRSSGGWRPARGSSRSRRS